MVEQEAEIQRLRAENDSLKYLSVEATEEMQKAQLIIQALNGSIENLEKKNNAELFRGKVIFLVILALLSGGCMYAYVGADLLLAVVFALSLLVTVEWFEINIKQNSIQ